MTKFLTTTGISHQIEETIKTAKEQIVIITPYLRINNRVKELLEDQDRFRIDIRLVYGKQELASAEAKWLGSMASIKTYFFENLHAKCYLNENQALITSMNLYEFSQINNYEMGLLVTRMDDRGLYDEIRKESKRIVRISDYKPSLAAELDKKTARKPVTKTPTKRSTKRKPKGFCIRCKRPIGLNPKKPYCRSCYTKWSKYSNHRYKEEACHACGSSHRATLVKPMCRSCRKKTKWS